MTLITTFPGFLTFPVPYIPVTLSSMHIMNMHHFSCNFFIVGGQDEGVNCSLTLRLKLRNVLVAYTSHIFKEAMKDKHDISPIKGELEYW